MKKMLIGLVFSFFLLSVFAGFAAGTADGSTSVTSVGTSTFTPTLAGSQAVKAGTIYDLNVAANSITDYWAAAWGNVSGSVQLRNSGGKDFKTWNLTSGTPQQNTGQNIYSLVLAYNNAATPNFGFGLTARSGSNIDTVTGVGTSLSDSASNTFNNVGNAFIVGNQSVASVANSMFFGNTFNVGSGVKTTGDSQYWTAAVNDGTSNLLFASPAVSIVWGDGGKYLFDNASYANYEMLLYANDSGTSAATAYSFYLELR